MTPREFIDRTMDHFTQEAISAGRKSAAMASNLVPEKLDQAMNSQAAVWQELVERLTGGEDGRKEERAFGTLRRPPRAPKVA